jgi:hypothetical protein
VVVEAVPKQEVIQQIVVDQEDLAVAAEAVEKDPVGPEMQKVLVHPKEIVVEKEIQDQVLVTLVVGVVPHNQVKMDPLVN